MSVSWPERVPARPQRSGTRCPQVRQRLLPVEFPLLGEELAAVDDRLASAEQTLFWHHEGTNPPLAAQGHFDGSPPRWLPAGPRSHHTGQPLPRGGEGGPRGVTLIQSTLCRSLHGAAGSALSSAVRVLAGVMEYIQETRGVLDDLQTRVQKAKLNVERITQLMEVAFAGAVWAPWREGVCLPRHSGAALSSPPCRNAQTIPCSKGRTKRTQRSWTWMGKQTP